MAINNPSMEQILEEVSQTKWKRQVANNEPQNYLAQNILPSSIKGLLAVLWIRIQDFGPIWIRIQA